MRKFLLFLLVAAVAPCIMAAEEVSHWHGSKTIPPHRIKLFDEEGEVIVPDCALPLPVSTKNTCGSCHNYETIGKGSHFKSGQSSHEGRTSEPWILVDETTGTQLPVSGDFALSPWKFVKAFGRHMPGGGIGEMIDDDHDPDARWGVSGKLEINCLGCHNASPRQDQSEWAKQIARESFRWAGTAASGIADVGGMASWVKPSWDIYDGVREDASVFAKPPFVEYDMSNFDHKGRAFLDVSLPDDKRCLYCHSSHTVGDKRIDDNVDVHTAAGLKCIDCHRNSLDHKMIRGYESEGLEKADDMTADFSCKGCHMESGRLGAPKPEHKGIPPVHFAKLSCTACHSGPMPSKGVTQVQTAKANRLGIYGIAQWSTDYPGILEPVFVKAEDGKITPSRMMWPAYWGYLDGKVIKPVDLDIITQTSKGILNPEIKIGEVLNLMILSPEQLKTLVSGEDDIYAKPVFVNSGKVYARNMDGELDEVAFGGAVPADVLDWAYLADEDQPRLIPFVQSLNEDNTGLGQSSESQAVLLTVLKRLAKSCGEPVVGISGKFFRMSNVEFVPVSPKEVKSFTAKADGAQKLKKAEMIARSIEKGFPPDKNYYRKIDWNYKRILLRKEDDLKDLQELADIAERAQGDRDLIKSFGKRNFTKCTKIKEVDVAVLKKESDALKAKLAAELKSRSLVFENNKFFKVEGGKKTRFYIMREDKDFYEDVFMAAEKAQKKVDSVREVNGVLYRKVFPDDTVSDVGFAEVKMPASSGSPFSLGWFEAGKVVPAVEDYLSKAIIETDKARDLFTEEQVAEHLSKLAGEVKGEPVYVAGGKVLKLDSAGDLIAVDHEAAAPVSWPIAHNVRAVSQSLGSGKCKQCHSHDSAFMFAEVKAMSPVKTDKVAVSSMSGLMGVSKDFNKIFGLTFMVRPLFKLALIGLSLLIIAVLVLYFLAGLKKVTEIISLQLIEQMTVIVTVLCLVFLSVTGFCFACCTGRELTGFLLLSHTVCGALFALCIAILAVFRAKACSFVPEEKYFSMVQKVVFWILLACAVILILSIVIAMFPILGTHAQHLAIVVHRYAAVLTVIVATVYGIAARKNM